MHIHCRTTHLVAVLGLFLGACATEGVVVVEPSARPVYYEGVSIPPGHMPPPGECRIWFPDRAPGQQPPPGDCRDLRHRVPPGAILIRG